MLVWIDKWGLLALAAIAIPSGFIWVLADSPLSDIASAVNIVSLLGILAFVVFRDSSPGAAQDTGGTGPGFIGQSDDQHQAQGGWLSNFLDGPGHGGGDGGGGHGGGHGGGGDGGGG